MDEEKYQLIARDFAKRLKQWRIATDTTQQELGFRCGLSVQSISDIEQGRHIATKRHILDIIERGFEISFERFFTDTPSRTQRQRVTGCRVPNLKAWRTYRGLKAKQLAERVGRTSATISHVENGGNASIALAKKIAAALGTTLEEMAAESPIHPYDYNPEDFYRNGKSQVDVKREFHESVNKLTFKARHERVVAAEETIQNKLKGERDLSRPIAAPESATEQQRKALEGLNQIRARMHREEEKRKATE